MAEHVVEDVGFLEIIELPGRADEVAGRKAPLAQMAEEDLVGDEAGDGDHRPAGPRRQSFVDLGQPRNAGMVEPEQLEAGLEGAHRPSGQLLLLAREQQVPDPMVLGGEQLPSLGNGPVPGGSAAFFVELLEHRRVSK
jgi:hypothetical protein